MKKIIIFLIALFCFFSGRQQLSAIGLSEFGVNVGIATPSEEVSNVYNSSSFKYGEERETGDIITEAAELGYHIGVNVRFGLTDNAFLVAGFGLNRFPETDLYFTDPTTGDTLAGFSSVTNIIPLSAGINYYLFRSFVGVYGIGEIQYNYISSSLDLKTENNIDIPLTQSPVDHALGAAIGAGIDFDLQVLTLNVEAKYNLANLIKMDDEEQAVQETETNEGTKPYFTLTLGVYF